MNARLVSVVSVVLVAAFFMFGSLWAAGGRAHAAEIVCSMHEVFVEVLRSQGYRRIGFGLDDSGELMEIFVKDADRRWRVIVTGRGGVSCGVARGRDWQDSKRRLDQ